ncbi:MAG: hypothetical protein ACE5DI_06410 [Candidatus Micrarchaeia archaeon]
MIVKMHRMIWLKIGGRRLHLFKLLGAVFGWAAALKLFESAYLIFLEVSKLKAAMVTASLVQEFYGWSMDSVSLVEGVVAYNVSLQDVLGVMAAPVANLLFWFGVVFVAIMVYRSGIVFFPIEEYDQQVQEHHRHLIKHAVKHHKKKKKK